MSWKQPTPTDINDNANLTAVERAVFREILSFCGNEDRLVHFIHAGRHYSVELKRGQCIFKVQDFARDFEINWKKVRRSIEILSKWYTRLESRAMPFGLVITMKDYDEIVKMENRMENRRRIEGEQKESRRRANKSVKSVKSVKIISKDITRGREDINECLAFLEEQIATPLDESQQMNRRYCKLLLDKLQKSFPTRNPVETVKVLIGAGVQDPWHGKHLSSFKYLYYNAGKIILSKKQQINSVVRL